MCTAALRCFPVTIGRGASQVIQAFQAQSNAQAKQFQQQLQSSNLQLQQQKLDFDKQRIDAQIKINKLEMDQRILAAQADRELRRDLAEFEQGQMNLRNEADIRSRELIAEQKGEFGLQEQALKGVQKADQILLTFQGKTHIADRKNLTDLEKAMISAGAKIDVAGIKSETDIAKQGLYGS